MSSDDVAHRRVRALSKQLLESQEVKAAASAAPPSPPFYNPDTPGVFDERFFHYIGETSPVIEPFIPKPRLEGGNNTRFLPRLKGGIPFLEYQGSQTVELFGGGGRIEVNRAMIARFGNPKDEELFFQDRRAKAKDFAVPQQGPVSEAVKLLEYVPFRDVGAVSAKALKEKQFSYKDAVAAAVVASNRSSEMVADHHGGPIHPTAGGFAILWATEMIKKAGGPGAEAWADLSVVQSMAIATKHIEVSRKLAGPAVMPELELTEEIAQMMDPKAVCLLLADALREKRPTRAERLVVRALELKADRDDLLTAVMEEAVPMNAKDDHYFLYPNFCFMTLDEIGWEYAPWVMRGLVRYLSTVPPYFRDRFTNADGNEVDLKKVPGRARRIEAIAEKLGLLEEGRVRPSPSTPEEKQAEEKQAEETVQLILSDFDEYPKISDDEILDNIPVRLAEAMANGLSLDGTLQALSLMAAQVFLRSSGGNPADVHCITRVGAQRHMHKHPNVPSRLKVLGLMHWASGFEIRASASVAVPQARGRRRNFLLGAQRTPSHAAKLLEAAGPEKPPMEDTSALLDYISRAITIRNQPIECGFPVAEGSGNLITHDQQMAMMYHDWLPNGGNSILVTDEVATKVFPAIWLYDTKAGGDLEAFFARIAAHSAMDDFSEMHVNKHTTICYMEALELPQKHRWLYMACAAKAVTNSSGCGYRVYESAATQVPDLTAHLQNQVPGWHPADAYMRQQA